MTTRSTFNVPRSTPEVLCSASAPLRPSSSAPLLPGPSAPPLPRSPAPSLPFAPAPLRPRSSAPPLPCPRAPPLPCSPAPLLDVRTSIPNAPCPTAGKRTSGGSASVTRWSRPSRFTPAAARMMASRPSLSSFRTRVSRFPRNPTIVRSGRWRRSCACRLRLLVPTRAPRGSAASRAPVREIRTSAGSSRSGMATMARPAGTSVGTSFMLWTARSTRPDKSASSISLTKSALPPTRASGTSRILSPVVRIRSKQRSRPGHRSRRRAATYSACHTASDDPRVPITRLRGSPLNVPRSPFRVARSTFSVQRSAFNLNPA